MTETRQEDDEQALVEAARRDRTRFLELYERNVHRVYAFSLRRTGNRADAEDVTSEVFHKALANFDTYEWRGIPFAAWLFRIAAHAVADRRRESARAAAGVYPPEVRADDPDLERQILLYQLVDRLAHDQRRVIELRFGEGCSIRDAAQQLGRSEGAIKQLQRRALENLRQGLEAHGG